jgi:hypothetical protein
MVGPRIEQIAALSARMMFSWLVFAQLMFRSCRMDFIEEFSLAAVLNARAVRSGKSKG